MKNFLFVSLFIIVAGCANRGHFVSDPEAIEVSQKVALFVGTDRGLDPEQEFDGSGFNGNRSKDFSYVQYDIAVPPDRDPGDVNWPKRNRQPNPRKDFLLLAKKNYADGEDFKATLSEALAEENHRALIFVHGFNTTLAEGAFRIAQLSYDLNLPGVPLLFSWPSAASPFAYIYDRESALYARDSLEMLIRQAESAGAKEVILVAHSMGSALLMETLRQIAISGDDDAFSKIKAVALIAPDIDTDVFKSQVSRIGTLPKPFVIFTSPKDTVLRISAGLTGDENRLGSLSQPEKLADLPILFVDTAAFNRGVGHFNFKNPMLIDLFRQFSLVSVGLGEAQLKKDGVLPGLLQTFRQATELILTPITILADQ